MTGVIGKDHDETIKSIWSDKIIPIWATSPLIPLVLDTNTYTND